MREAPLAREYRNASLTTGYIAAEGKRLPSRVAGVIARPRVRLGSRRNGTDDGRRIGNAKGALGDERRALIAVV